MGNPALDIGQLDTIIKGTVAAIESGKAQIYSIAESAQDEYRRIECQLKEAQKETRRIIQEVDYLERREVKARWHLMEVSRNFSQVTESDIHLAYEEAKNIQIELAQLQEREKLLRQRRDELERTLRNLRQLVEKAERLISQVGVAMDFLQGNLDGIAVHLEGIQERHQLAAGIIKAQEEERRRVAREIHDGPAQSLVNLVFRIEVCEKLIAVDARDKVLSELKALKLLIKNSIQDVRKIIFDLRPMALDDLGLLPVLRRYLEGLEMRENLSVEFIVLGEEFSINPTIEAGIFRIVQEALNNVAKHARANNVKLAISFSPALLIKSVCDNGTGFDPEEVKEYYKKGEHFGLISMRERAELLNGKFEIKSAPGKGTRLKFTIPVDNSQMKEEDEWNG